jgi:hypothetical protein
MAAEAEAGLEAVSAVLIAADLADLAVVAAAATPAAEVALEVVEAARANIGWVAGVGSGAARAGLLIHPSP